MTPRPFLLRLLLPFALIMALIVAVCGAAVYWADQRAVRTEQVRQLDNLTALVKPWVAESDQALDAPRQAQLRSAAEALRTRVTLIDGDGHVFFDTLSEPRVRSQPFAGIDPAESSRRQNSSKKPRKVSPHCAKPEEKTLTSASTSTAPSASRPRGC